MLAKTELTERYIHLLKQSLVGNLYIENECRIICVVEAILDKREITYNDLFHVDRNSGIYRALRDESKVRGATIILRRQNADGTFTPIHDLRNFTELSHTMIGQRRLDNIQHCVETVIADGIAGDLIETGVWRGGATIFMRGLLAAYGDRERNVWVADSFQGVPPPTHPEDGTFDISVKKYPFLAVSQKEVAELFERYGLLDNRVRFLEGWFKDTLSTAPIEKLAILRLDGDLYESTMDALQPLYAKVSPGGFVIVDDYFSCPPCERAIHDFRAANGITDEMIQIDAQSVYWRKS